MRLAVVSDLHFGYSRFYEDSFGQAARALEKAVEMADAVLIPGDLFDSRTPRQEVFERAFRVFECVLKKKWGVRVKGFEGLPPVIVIPGTHERRTKDQTNAIHVMEAAGFVVNAHLRKCELELGGDQAARRGAESRASGGERVVVQGLGGVPEDWAAAAIEKENYQPVQGAFNIFMLHQSMSELLPDDKAMSIEDLPKGFDLYVNGHLHKNQIRKVEKAQLIIPGSTVLTQMKKGEEGEKGFYVYETKTREADFIPIKTRPFFYREINFEGASLSDVMKRCEKEVKELVSGAAEKPIIKLKLKGTLAQGLELANLQIKMPQELNEKCYLDIDKSLEDSDVDKKISFLRDVREQKISIREMGMELLKKRLEMRKSRMKGVEELFEQLTEKDAVETVFRKLSMED